MVDVIDDGQFLEKYQRTVEAANKASAIEPQAASAHYDAMTHLIVVRLNSRASFRFPLDIAQGLAGASPKALTAVENISSGIGLYRGKLDANFFIMGLLIRCFGTKA